MAQLVKIMGERNSGTNFLFQALLNNSELELAPNAAISDPLRKFITTRKLVPRSLRLRWIGQLNHRAHCKGMKSNGGWKHAAITEHFCKDFISQNDAKVLCIIRHPLAWARSMHKHPFEKIGDIPAQFDDFIRQPWVLNTQDELPLSQTASPLALWKLKLMSYRKFADKNPNILIVRYEDLLFDLESVSQRISRFLGQKNLTIQLPELSARKFIQDGRNLEQYRAAAEKTSFSELKSADRQIFFDHIGATLLREYGYLDA